GGAQALAICEAESGAPVCARAPTPETTIDAQSAHAARAELLGIIGEPPGGGWSAHARSGDRFGRHLGLELGNALAGTVEILALLELLHQLFVQWQRLGLELLLHEGLGEVEVGRVASGVTRIALENRLEPIDRARIPAIAEVEEADLKIR